MTTPIVFAHCTGWSCLLRASSLPLWCLIGLPFQMMWQFQQSGSVESKTRVQKSAGVTFSDMPSLLILDPWEVIASSARTEGCKRDPTRARRTCTGVGSLQLMYQMFTRASSYHMGSQMTGWFLLQHQLISHMDGLKIKDDKLQEFCAMLKELLRFSEPIGLVNSNPQSLVWQVGAENFPNIGGSEPT